MAISGTAMVDLERAISKETPVTLWPIRKLTELAIGKPRTEAAIAAIQRPIVHADIAAGKAVTDTVKKLTGHDTKLFTVDRVLKDSAGNRHVHEVPVLTAPVEKAGKIVLPLVGAATLSQAVKETSKKKEADMEPVVTPELLRKTAATLQSLQERVGSHEKRAQAEEILFAQVERGLVPAPRSHKDFETKVAALMDQDLAVAKEALKFASASNFGTLEEGPSIPSGGSEAQMQFQHALMEV